ncbi:hypothetical protein DOTSEDRAFT_124793 [Dothistroma septosporum NZE10]|uniref:ASX DEUBAD domain-containing protein n=1 Tax=Dothistroma septosporum (strain NZE10 / CBS 128990) TaxID=675120 RepID=N1PW55_DOTSN|nr:hypothetical protein DOTSEDRAFT_124793 [Dothistroma septosporum NZE10]
MGPNQKTWLVNKSSKLGKIELTDLLRKNEAWALLPQEDRQKLYNMLPKPQEGEAQHNLGANPMQTMYRPYIEAELRKWQDDLREGKETKAWREQAIEAGKEREKGVWDEWKEAQRQLDWGLQDEHGNEGGDWKGKDNRGKEANEGGNVETKKEVQDVEENRKETAKEEER